MITVRINKNDETVTYSTLVNVEGRLMSFRMTKYLYYQPACALNHSLLLTDEYKDFKIDLFELLFHWPKEYYTSAKRNHFVYHNLIDTNFHRQTKKNYEVNWEEIFVKLDPKNKNVLLISNNKDFEHKNTMLMAIPPNTPGLERYDYVTDDGMYHYNSKKGEHEGIEIYFNGIEKIISW